MAWFLLAASVDAPTYAVFSAFINSIIGRLVLFGFTWALFHHLCGGVRHILMETGGYGLDDPQREQFAAAHLVGGIVLDDPRLDPRLRGQVRSKLMSERKSYRTPLGRVRWLGSAGFGTDEADG